MPSSPVSDLSALNSEDFDEDVHHSRSDNELSTDAFDDNDSSAVMPPSKRRRVAHPRRSLHRDDAAAASARAINAEEATYDTDVSSDSTGLPEGSPYTWREIGMPADEWELGEEQVKVCIWEGCDVGDLGDQDELVKHINDVHVADAKQRYFICEWGDCRAKGKPQMSAYALRAHLRSHTKEKPFFCSLPECDRSFTRSDALAKHMRTVHETESAGTCELYQIKLRSQIPKTAELSNKIKAEAEINGTESSRADASASKPPQRLKLVFNKDKSSAPPTPQHNGTDSADSDTGTNAPLTPLSPGTRDTLFGPFPEHLQFSKEEAALPRRELFRILRRQTQWARRESESLQERIQELEKKRREEWLAKELVLENVLEAELAGASKRDVFDEGGHDSMFGEPAPLDWADKPVGGDEREKIFAMLEDDAKAASHLPLQGPGVEPWYRSFVVKRKLKESIEVADGEPAHGSEGEAPDGEADGASSDDSEGHVEEVPLKGRAKKKAAAAAAAVRVKAGDETEEDK